MYSTNLNEGWDSVHPYDRDRYKKTFNQALKKSRGYSIEYRMIRKDMTVVYVSEEVERSLMKLVAQFVYSELQKMLPKGNWSKTSWMKASKG